MRYCKNCHRPISDDAVECPFCAKNARRRKFALEPAADASASEGDTLEFDKPAAKEPPRAEGSAQQPAKKAVEDKRAIEEAPASTGEPVSKDAPVSGDYRPENAEASPGNKSGLSDKSVSNAEAASEKEKPLPDAEPVPEEEPPANTKKTADEDSAPPEPVAPKKKRPSKDEEFLSLLNEELSREQEPAAEQSELPKKRGLLSRLFSREPEIDEPFSGAPAVEPERVGAEGENGAPAHNETSHSAPEPDNAERDRAAKEPAVVSGDALMDELPEEIEESPREGFLFRLLNRASAKSAEASPADAPAPDTLPEPASDVEKTENKLYKTLFDDDSVKTEEVVAAAKKREDVLSGATGELEAELAELDAPADEPEDEEPTYNKAGISLAAVLLIAAAALGIVLVKNRLTAPAPVEEEGVMTSYICGDWISDEFAFVDNEDRVCRELLTINDDGTFKTQYLIVDKQTPKGYLDGSWEVYYTFSGEIIFSADDNSLVLRLEKNDAEKEQFMRYLVSTSDSSMTLREYYNKTKTDYYDVVFVRATLDRADMGEPVTTEPDVA